MLSPKAEHSESQCLADVKPYLACLADPLEDVAVDKTIEAQLQAGDEEERKRAEQFKTPTASNVRINAKPTRLKFYPDMAEDVPNDTSSPEAEKICTAFRKSLQRGNAPRLTDLAEYTGLEEATIQTYLDCAPWIRKDDSSPAGIVVYLPVEAEA